MKTNLFVVVVSLAALLSTSVFAQKDSEAQDTAQDKEEVVEKKKLDPGVEFMMEHTKGYVGTRASDGAKIEALDEPLLRWTNPNLNIQHGLYVGWVDADGRPMAVAQLYRASWGQKRWFIEQQSLCDAPMIFQSESNTTWIPKKAGIEWKVAEGKTPDPAKTAPLRLAQMRGLARRFRVEDKIDDDSVLRLLPSPMMRYSVPKKGIVDGALFVMVNGTDPEVTLQIEIREDTTTKKSAFYWALSPMTTYELTGYLDDVQVWYMSHKKPITSQETFHGHPLSGTVDLSKK